ncbi:FAD-binding oxidoreductase [Nocardia jejuensis]|uniref:FAD-binding oxidoreductase n=1 Tax=Nocardia jejuensis TaxID=328049 RepID=UPI00082EA522|nr:FAD-binding oxidoreductase [Nocardia jejuensis]
MDIETLRTTLHGTLHLPGEPGYAGAAQPWELTITQAVAAVADVADVHDIQEVVRFAAATGRRVVTQSTGHGASGGIDGEILLRTRALDHIEIDPTARLARVGAGATWGQVQTAAAAHGLSGLAGSNPSVGVTGYTLGGGIGWLARKHGWASNAVRAFDIVHASGGTARVTAESDPDLFWALRGGGGDYAIVTDLEFDLFDTPQMYGGQMMWPDNRAREIFEVFTDLTAAAPPELSIWFERFAIPGLAPTAGVFFAYLGDENQGRASTARLDTIDGILTDTRAMLTPDQLGRIAAEPTEPSHSLAAHEILTDLDDAVIKTLVEDPVAPALNIEIRGLGAALAENQPDGGARGALREQYVMFLRGLPLPGLRDDVEARFAEITAQLGAHRTGGKLYTFLAPEDTAGAAFDHATLTRLRHIKQAHDPHGTFHANYPVHH